MPSLHHHTGSYLAHEEVSWHISGDAAFEQELQVWFFPSGERATRHGSRETSFYPARRRPRRLQITLHDCAALPRQPHNQSMIPATALSSLSCSVQATRPDRRSLRDRSFPGKVAEGANTSLVTSSGGQRRAAVLSSLHQRTGSYLTHEQASSQTPGGCLPTKNPERMASWGEDCLD
jgi:hypothetical protein